MSWTKPSAQDLYDTIDETWAPFAKELKDGWCIREGRGGGKRVSAANQEHVSAEISAAEAAMTALKQPALFMIRDGFPTLEMHLAKRGYSIIDPVVMLAKRVADKGSDLAADFLDTPSAAQLAIWQDAGIDENRIAVMDRVKGPKTFLQTEGATGFIAMHEEIAMVHAVEVHKDQRRKGFGRQLMLAASMWAGMKGANTISVVATRQNRPAQALYKSLGYDVIGNYHYRIKR